MAKSDTRLTVLQIINSVQESLGVDVTSDLSSNKQTKVLLRCLNDTMDEISDFGDWQEMYTEISVPVVSGQSIYTFGSAGVSYPIKNLYEIAYFTRPQSLYNVEIEEINRLSRIASTTFGEPRQFAIKGVDVYGNPKFQVHPRPGVSQGGKTFNVAVYRKPRNNGVNSVAEEVEFPGNLVVLGVLYRALIHENGGQTTDQSKQIRAQFENELEECLNRFNGDTGTFIQIYPARKM